MHEAGSLHDSPDAYEILTAHRRVEPGLTSGNSLAGPGFRAIRYLGNKRKLVDQINEAIDDVGNPGNHVLDLFAGSCCVGYSLKSTHQVTSNDNQIYSFHLAKALIENESDRPSALEAALELDEVYYSHRYSLARRLNHDLNLERDLLLAGSRQPDAIRRYQAYCHRTPYINSLGARCELAGIVREARLFRSRSSSTNPWTLFTTYFANTYFGLWQCVEIDALRKAIDEAASCQNGWRKHVYLAALIYTLSQTVSSPGHFAEYFKPHSAKAFGRIQRERTKSIWATFLSNVTLVSSMVLKSTRMHRVLSQDWTAALTHHALRSDEGPGVIYADPPYTADHYSRYYHVLDTLIRYDYPSSDGAGRYRSNRQASRFSIKSKAPDEFDALAKSASRSGASLVLSYSNRGVLSLETLTRICKRHYKSVHRRSIPHRHSNQGRATSECSPNNGNRREYLLMCSEPS